MHPRCYQQSGSKIHGRVLDSCNNRQTEYQLKRILVAFGKERPCRRFIRKWKQTCITSENCDLGRCPFMQFRLSYRNFREKRTTSRSRYTTIFETFLSKISVPFDFSPGISGFLGRTDSAPGWQRIAQLFPSPSRTRALGGRIYVGICRKG